MNRWSSCWLITLNHYHRPNRPKFGAKPPENSMDWNKTMKAISLTAPKEIKIVDIPTPKVGPEDVLVDIHYIGLCGSDLNAYRGLMPLLTYPRILGHEISGVITTKGDRVPISLNVGDKVMLSPYTHCDVCPAC